MAAGLGFFSGKVPRWDPAAGGGRGGEESDILLSYPHLRQGRLYSGQMDNVSNV